MKLLELPPEILNQVLEKCPRQTLAVLLRTSKKLNLTIDRYETSPTSKDGSPWVHAYCDNFPEALSSPVLSGVSYKSKLKKDITTVKMSRELNKATMSTLRRIGS